MRKMIGLVLLVLVACSGEKADRSNPRADATDAASAPSVRTIALPELEQMIRNRDGRQLVINMWATWCVPCKEEFPDLVKLAEKTQVTAEVVGISLDDPDEIASRVIPFLRQNPVNFSIHVAEVESQDDFINFFNADWSGALPTTFIYDSSGHQTAMMVGKHTLTDFEETLAQASSAGNSE